MSIAYISIGSNLGDRLGYIKQAIAKLEQSQEIEIRNASSVYETEPLGHKEQPRFLNIVLQLKTSLEPSTLLEHLLRIENQMGRKRDQCGGTEFVRWGPRNIDLDLLLFDDAVINSDKLTLPHPRMHHRRFVLVPLAEIAPKVVHSLLKKSIKRLLEELSTDSVQSSGHLSVTGKDKFEVRLYSEKVF